MLIRKLFNKEALIESMGIVTIFMVLQRIIQVGRGVVFARLLGPNNYGTFTLAFFFIPLVVQFAHLGIPACFQRYIVQYEKRGLLKDFFSKNCLLSVCSSVFIVFSCLFFSKQIASMLFGSPAYQCIIILCLLTVIPYVLYENFTYFFSGLRIFKMSALLKFSQFLIFTLLGIGIVIFYPRVDLVIFANLFSFILVAIFFGLIIKKYILNSIAQSSKVSETNFYNKMLRYSIWFIISPVVFIIFKFVDRLMINYFLGLQEVGIYSVASNITGIIFTFGMIGENVLIPNLAKVWEGNDKPKVMFMLNLSIKITTLFLFCGAAILVLFRSPIVSILYGSKYLGGISVIGILSIFWLFNSILWILEGYGKIIEKPYLTFAPIVFGIIINILLNLIFIPLYGIVGAAIATTTALGIILLVIYLLYKKQGLKIESRTIFVCLLPLILLLNNAVIGSTLIILLSVIFATEFILAKEEKKLLFQQIKIITGKKEDFSST